MIITGLNDIAISYFYIAKLMLPPPSELPPAEANDAKNGLLFMLVFVLANAPLC